MKTGNVYEIKENIKNFELLGWIMSKNSDKIEWKMENKTVAWTRTPPVRYLRLNSMIIDGGVSSYERPEKYF